MLSTPTRMCVVCVLRRILDCMCGESVFRSLGGVIRSVQDMCGVEIPMIQSSRMMCVGFCFCSGHRDL